MTSSKSKTAGAPDAIELLTADHKEVHGLFVQFKKLKEDASAGEKGELVEQICNALTVHTQIEEEIFYPAVRKAIEDEDLMDEALVEHAGAKSLIAQLQEMDPDDDLYDAKVTVLGEQIDHHVKEEEGEMFPSAKKAKIDLDALGQEMADQKAELMAQLAAGSEGAPAEDDDEDTGSEREGAKRRSASR